MPWKPRDGRYKDGPQDSDLLLTMNEKPRPDQPAAAEVGGSPKVQMRTTEDAKTRPCWGAEKSLLLPAPPGHNPGASVLAWPWETQTGTRWCALLAPRGGSCP